MRLLTVKLQNQEVKADLLNPKIAKKYEDGFYSVLKKYQEAKNVEPGSEGIRMQCQATIDYVAEIFGEDAARKVFGSETDLLTCLDVLEEMQNLYDTQVVQVIQEKMPRFERPSKDGE